MMYAIPVNNTVKFINATTAEAAQAQCLQTKNVGDRSPSVGEAVPILDDEMLVAFNKILGAQADMFLRDGPHDLGHYQRALDTSRIDFIELFTKAML